MLDRWRPKDAIDGRYVWLPIEFQGRRPIIRWRDQWDLSVFDKTVSAPETSLAPQIAQTHSSQQRQELLK
jgi:hypothetical protein